MGSLKTGNYKNGIVVSRFNERNTTSRPPTSKYRANQDDQSRIKPAESILLTGGVGDVLTLESYFDSDHREKLTSVYYATRQHKLIKQLFDSLPNYPNLKKHIILWDDWSKFFDFVNKEQVVDKLKEKEQFTEDNFVDWSIMHAFRMAKEGFLKYQSSSFIRCDLCKIDKFNLPPNYITVCPYTADKRLYNRDFNQQDWSSLLKRLSDSGRKGVVINQGNENIPDDPLLINLNNKTTLTEAIEILKHSSGYNGIDSCLSVLAAKLFDFPDLIIKTVNAHCLNFKEVYFSPRKDFRFLSQRI